MVALMKRDLELIRKILLATEAHQEPNKTVQVKFEGVPDELVQYNTGLLLEAGYVEAVDMSNLSGRHFGIWRLTWEGHDFLDAARNDTLWKKAREKVVGTVGTVTLDIMKEVLISLAKDTLGLKS
jgi:hypothetical protein